MIYLDHHSTTPMDPSVLDAMLPYLKEHFGNPSNRSHAYGWTADAAVNVAREKVAQLIGASPSEIIFTSGTTESVHLALHGIAEAYENQGRHIIATATEHKCVLAACEQLKKKGFRITVLPVNSYGQVSVEQVAQALEPDTILVSIIAANNEVGSLNPISEIGALCKSQGVLFHTDAAQAAGKIPLNVQTQGIDLLSLSGHKLYGPKGIGALYVRRKKPRVTLVPQFVGGEQERGLRAGTLNVPAIVGLGRAVEICQSHLSEESERLRTLRDSLWNSISSRLVGVRFNGHPTERLPHNLNVTFDGIDGEPLVMALKGIAFSTGSACSTESRTLSHVLLAMGLSEAEIHGTVRLGLGRFTTPTEIQETADRMVEAVRTLRELSFGVPSSNQITESGAYV